MGLTYEQHEARSLHFDELEQKLLDLRKQLKEARQQQQTAALHAQDWEAQSQLLDVYGEVACLDFRRAAGEWKGREARAATEVARLEKELGELELRIADFWE